LVKLPVLQQPDFPIFPVVLALQGSGKAWVNLLQKSSLSESAER
jgi:hypothetical protein